MSKFANVRAEAAYVIATHGFTDEQYGESGYGDGWNALVTVSAQVLMNLGEEDLWKSFYATHEGSTMFVWVREDSQGFVHCIDQIWDTNRESLKRIEDRWNAWYLEVVEIEDDPSSYPEHVYQTPSPGLVAIHPDQDPMECGECGEVHADHKPGDTIPAS